MFGLLGEEAEPFLSLQWYAGVIELFGGAAIMAGLLTRPVAFVCSGEMAFAYFINHNPRGFFPIQNGGERAALFCFYFLFLSAAGPGKWSVDARSRGACM
jgi:putative oxidoreductase